jgi:N-acetylglutamate synthase-like GNAT family acetyltransferase
MTMKIEPATPSDAPSIASVFFANRDDHGLFREREAELRLSWPNFLVARDANGTVVGCAGLHRDPHGWAEIFGVAVLPGLQNQGIGSMLMRGWIDEAAAKGVAHLWLATMKPDYFARFSFRPMPSHELPAAVRLRKLWRVFHQPIDRWGPVLIGRRHVFMQRELSEARAGLGDRAGQGAVAQPPSPVPPAARDSGPCHSEFGSARQRQARPQ